MTKNSVEKLVFNFFGIITFLIVLIVVSILGFIIFRGIGKISWEFISSAPTDGMMKGGILPAILGTLVLILGSCIVAFPVGIFSGIFMNEYAKESVFKKFVGMMTNNLAGIPSVVFGLFGLALFVNFFNFGVSILSGCLTLAILIVPVIIRTTEESLKLVEDSYRLASYALGASKFETVFRVVLPMAFPNIITGLILSIGRVAGETAPIIFTVAAYYLPEIILSLNSPVMALPYHLYVMATSGIDLNKSRDIAFGTALVLMA
ncbi:MAG: phosphate ABC transporter permease PstA, partial [Cytophagales bacterium]